MVAFVLASEVCVLRKLSGKVEKRPIWAVFGHFVSGSLEQGDMGRGRGRCHSKEENKEQFMSKAQLNPSMGRAVGTV